MFYEQVKAQVRKRVGRLSKRDLKVIEATISAVVIEMPTLKNPTYHYDFDHLSKSMAQQELAWTSAAKQQATDLTIDNLKQTVDKLVAGLNSGLPAAKAQPTPQEVRRDAVAELLAIVQQRNAELAKAHGGVDKAALKKQYPGVFGATEEEN
jgi:hypothetical protein